MKAKSAVVARTAGIAISLLSVAGLVAGMAWVQSLGSDTRASISASRSALAAISQTVEAVDDVAVDTAASITAASRSVDAASATVDGGVRSLDGVATLLEEELPETIESVSISMPAAIQTANAVDRTLRTLSFFGVDYDPEEPFGESLSRINIAVASLPGELRAQSESIRELIPSGERFAEEIDQLSITMQDLEESLGGFTSLTSTYESTIADAEASIEQTDGSVASSLWMLRAIVVAGAIAGFTIGLVLVSLGRDIRDLHARISGLTRHSRRGVETSAP